MVVISAYGNNMTLLIDLINKIKYHWDIHQNNEISYHIDGQNKKFVLFKITLSTNFIYSPIGY